MATALLRLVASASLVAVGVASTTTSFADDATAVDDDSVILARREFLDGTSFVKAEQWGDALAAFERAEKLKPHAITLYNIAQCERAMGQYTRARSALVLALTRNEETARAGHPELAESVELDARAILAQLDRVLPRARVTLRPEGASVAVDGRPLERIEDPPTGPPVLIAGTLAPGIGAPVNVTTFELVANPGPHVLTVARQGYQDVVLSRSFAASSTTALSLELDRLPATIHVTSNLADAIVRVNGADVGNVPAEVARVSGHYRVVVSRKGFVPFDSEVNIRPGERFELAATLREDRPALTQRWWFWAGTGVVVVGAALATYFLTRSSPEPTRPATDGGGLGWSLKVP